MTRNLKALGLALLAVFAFAAISASTASAETKIDAKFTATPDETVNVTSTVVGAGHKLELAGFSVLECIVTEFHSHVEKGGTTSFTVAPIYEKCVSHIGGPSRPATVTMNGCTYTFTVHELDATHIKGTGQMHILCPEGQRIETHVYEAGDTEYKGPPRCTYDIVPQTIETGISYENMAKGNLTPNNKTVTLETNNAPIQITKTSGALLKCGGVNLGAGYVGKVESHAINAGGNPIDLELVTDNTP